jgi:hypothetical protein
MLFIYSTVEKKEVTFTPRFLGIDEANNFANLLRATLPKHGFIISEPYPIVRDSLEKEFHDCCESSSDLLGRLDELT